MELRTELSQREVQLGGEQQHRQPGLQPEPAVVEPHADGDRDERDPQRRRKLQHGAREEADTQRAHGRAAIPLADFGDRRGLRLAPVECAQRRQATHDVEVVRRQEAQRVPALAGPLFRVPADQPHEDRHERQRDEHDEGRGDVDHGHPDEHGKWDEARQHNLRQVAAEVRGERVDAGDTRTATSPASTPSSPAGSASRCSASASRRSERTVAAARRPANSKPHPSSARAANTQVSSDERGLDVAERCAVERAGDDAREHRRLNEDEQGRCRAEQDVGTEEHADGTGAAYEARVERAHGSGCRPLALQPVPEDVVRPALVEEDDRQHDQRDDGQDHQRVVGRRGVLDREAVREVGLETITRG